MHVSVSVHVCGSAEVMVESINRLSRRSPSSHTGRFLFFLSLIFPASVQRTTLDRPLNLSQTHTWRQKGLQVIAWLVLFYIMECALQNYYLA